MNKFITKTQRFLDRLPLTAIKLNTQMKRHFFFIGMIFNFISCYSQSFYPNPDLVYKRFKEIENTRIIDRCQYKDQLNGYWLGTCIANWTGLVTEMDKIGNIGNIKTGTFYTR